MVGDERLIPLGRDEPELRRDEVFEVLSNPRRRLILHYLKQQADRDRVDLRELVDHVTAWENDIPVEEVSSAQRNRVYTALRQSHLPKMDETGVIEYDNLRGEVGLTDGAREAQLYLEYVPEEDIHWSYVYLGLSTVAASVVALTALSVPPFGGLTWFGLAVLSVVLFGATGVVHAVCSRRNRLGNDDDAMPERLR